MLKNNSFFQNIAISKKKQRTQSQPRQTKNDANDKRLEITKTSTRKQTSSAIPPKVRPRKGMSHIEAAPGRRESGKRTAYQSGIINENVEPSYAEPPGPDQSA